MTLEFRDGRFVSRLFYTELLERGGRNGNLLGMIYRDQSGPWHVIYRFRYYADDDLTRASKDERSWYEAECKGDFASALQSVRLMFRLAGVGTFDEIVVDSDRGAVCIGALLGAPWAHLERKPHDRAQ